MKKKKNNQILQITHYRTATNKTNKSTEKIIIEKINKINNEN